jgi:hypothetical protein
VSKRHSSFYCAFSICTSNNGVSRSADKGLAEGVGFADTGRFTHSMLPKVSLRPWFEGQKEERSFGTSVSRIMSGHSSVRSHLDGFRIVEDPMCVCLKDSETVYHLIRHYVRFGPESPGLNVLHGTPVRDLRKWSAINCCLDFLGSFKIGI